MTDTITLFDLPSRPPCQTWSYNPWKTRMLLNYKGLPYKTEWLEYPDIKARLKDHFPSGHAAFTIPTVMMPDGKYIMESRDIATALEAAYPEPSIRLDSPYLPRIEKLLADNFPDMRGVIFDRIPGRVLNEYSIPYWLETRSKRTGMPLDQFVREHGGDKVWVNAGPWLKEAAAMLRENDDGPFFMGKTVCYADFVWAGFLIFLQRQGDDVIEACLNACGDREAYLRLLEAVKPWSDRCDH